MGALTEQGFKRPIFAELLETQIKRAKELFGDDIETDEKTPLGKFIRITVYDLANAYEDLEDCYYARFPNTASGASLDRLCVFAGISRNPASAAAYNVKITGTAGYTIPSGFLVGTDSGVTYYVEDDTLIPTDGYVTVQVFCSELGTVGNVANGAIYKVVNPEAHITNVEQISQTIVAKDEETDFELRQRFAIAISGLGSATAAAIKAEVMRVTNVRDCIISENETDETNSDGVPPHSFQAFVTCDDTLNQSVAEAIFRKKPVGIHSYGDITESVTAEDGTQHTVKFSKSIAKDIYITMTILKNSDFATDGTTQIKNSLIDYISTFRAGEDVLKSSLYGYIHKVNGVVAVTSLTLSDGTTSGDSVVMQLSDIANLEASNITIEVQNYADNSVL